MGMQRAARTYRENAGAKKPGAALVKGALPGRPIFTQRAASSIRTSFSMRNGGVVSCPQPVSYFAMR